MEPDDDVSDGADATPASGIIREGLRRLVARNTAGELRETLDSGGTSRTSSSAGLELGRRFGHFVVRDFIGRGGMGLVLEAHDRGLDRPVALKVLHARYAQRHAQRLLREARALARISHPNVVQVHEVGVVDGQLFIAMELVRGLTLRQWQDHESPSWRRCVQVYLQAGRGLAAAHAEGIVHRDFKPHNCIIDPRGRVRVLDFGLARGPSTVVSDDLPEFGRDGETTGESAGQGLTDAGAVVGTLAYIPPEQQLGLPADERSDQFGFCVSLYEALYGQRPFAGDTAGQRLERLRAGAVRPPPPGARVPKSLRRALLRGLAFEPENRWPSMPALLVELERVARPRWRRWMGVAFLGGAITLLGAGIWHQALVGRLCEGAPRHLKGVWDDDRRARVRVAILETELSYAEDTWPRVQQRIDAYAEQWVAKHTEVCEATSVRREQSAEMMDLRMTCLAGRRAALREAVDVLAEADETTVEQAVTMLANLPSLGRCDDIEALRARVPPPDDPSTAQRVAVVRQQLAEARVLHDAGRSDRSLEHARAAVQSAEKLAYPPLLAEAKSLRGTVSAVTGNIGEGEHDLEAAYSMAISIGYVEVALEAATSLIYNVGYLQSRHDEALIWSTTAQALGHRPSVPVGVRSRMLHNIAVVHSERGKLDQALEYERNALSGLEGVTPSPSPRIASIFNSMATMHRRQRRYDLALDLHRKSLALREEALGPGHPLVASTLNGLAVTLQKQGRLEEARTEYERAISTYERSASHEHVNFGHTLNNAGNLSLQMGDLGLALRHYRRALALYRRVSGADAPRVAQTLNNIGLVLSQQGASELAIEHFEDALSIFEARLDPLHPNIIHVLASMGTTFQGVGELGRANEHLVRARQMAQQGLGGDDPLVADLSVSLGEVAEARGSTDEAFEYYEDAAEIFAGVLDSDDPQMIPSWLGMARVELVRGNSTSARDYGERALSIAEPKGVPPDVLAAARFVVARAMWSDRPSRPSARALAEKARDACVELGRVGEAPGELEWIEAWIAEHPLQ